MIRPRFRTGALALFAGLCVLASHAQTVAKPDPEAEAREQRELAQTVSEAGTSAIDLIRGLELYLKKYPETKQRPLIEGALLKSAMETNDNARIVLYGERVLQRDTQPDQADVMQTLDRVTRALVDKSDREQARRAIGYAERYESDVERLRAKMEPPGHLTAGQWSEELNKALARALALEARATGYAGNPEAAAKLAVKSWDTYPTGEGAREAGYWLSSLGRKADAIQYYANAFTVEDPHNTEDDRAGDRARLGSLYAELNGSQKGLGDAILEAYDRTSALLSGRREALKEKDPNAVANGVEDFRLPAVDKAAPPLVLAALKGKTVVLDFWATWCVPCRAEEPVLDKLRTRYRDTPDVVFAGVATDEDPSLVMPFLKDQGWKNTGYLDAGMARTLNINSIPTVLVIDPNGHVLSRMIGFIPDRFEDMLKERVEEARKIVPAK